MFCCLEIGWTQPSPFFPSTRCFSRLRFSFLSCWPDNLRKSLNMNTSIDIRQNVYINKIVKTKNAAIIIFIEHSLNRLFLENRLTNPLIKKALFCQFLFIFSSGTNRQKIQSTIPQDFSFRKLSKNATKKHTFFHVFWCFYRSREWKMFLLIHFSINLYV